MTVIMLFFSFIEAPFISLPCLAVESKHFGLELFSVFCLDSDGCRGYQGNLKTVNDSGSVELDSGPGTCQGLCTFKGRDGRVEPQGGGGRGGDWGLLLSWPG